jgi:hypothetical protein
MQNFRIFTESKADIKFLRDYIEEVFKVKLEDENFDSLGNWAGYKAGGNLSASIKQNTEDSKTNILILDADVNIESRRKEVVEDFQKYNIPIKLFLFPNDAYNGALENILCETATKKDILACFDKYQECIKGHEVPVIKSKVFAYLDALLASKNKKNDKRDLIQDKNRNYRNTEHWDLKHEFLNPLKVFLTPFFEK